MTEALTKRDDILAGNSVFKIESLKTGRRFTYRVRVAWEGVHCAKSLHVVGVLVNPDNERKDSGGMLLEACCQFVWGQDWFRYCWTRNKAAMV